MVVSGSVSIPFERLGGVTKLTDNFRIGPDFSSKTTHTKMQFNSYETNEETNHLKNAQRHANLFFSVGVVVPPPWDSLLSLPSSPSASEPSGDSSAPSIEAIVLFTEPRTSKAGGMAVSGRPRVDVRTSLTVVHATVGKVVETAGNTTPEEVITPAVVTETVAEEVVPS